MKVLDLLCANQHRFEGWFASEDDFVAQVDRGLLACPMCAETAVSRLPSAPRLNVSKAREPKAQMSEASSDATEPAPAAADAGARLKARAESQMLRAMRHVLANTEDVGERFPEEARRIHYGEAAERGIRGRATREQAEALVEEGIEVIAIAVPPALERPTH